MMKPLHLMITSLSALKDKAIEAMQRSSATLISLLIDASSELLSDSELLSLNAIAIF